ncbi:hypothetical protein D6D01_01050 [Aureobasidium pullulans]|uniref:Uncharacterized protein n=1 Tax=Aureobasidium pullulans TaxID=5580 RepID=A0A4S9M071_AURPU|nr:hypothetical protein D6D01_01050 [Aureobasidium pullulans]
MSATARKDDTSLEAVEKPALFTHIYLVHLDQSRHDLYAIYQGFPSGVDMPSHLKLPSISELNRDTKIEQQVTKLLFEERDKLRYTKLGEDATVVAEICATEFEKRLDFYWWRVRTSYTAYRKNSDEWEKKKFRVGMMAVANSMKGKRETKLNK